MKGGAEMVNKSVEHGKWGEDYAAAFLSFRGYEIFDRNVRPCPADQRLEIDIIAFERRSHTLVFVEVKQHAEKSEYARRMQSVDRRKMRLLRRACKAWLMKTSWAGAYRFDVIEIYGVPGMFGKPEIDHIQHVRLFSNSENFVNWEN